MRYFHFGHIAYNVVFVINEDFTNARILIAGQRRKVKHGFTIFTHILETHCFQLAAFLHLVQFTANDERRLFTMENCRRYGFRNTDNLRVKRGQLCTLANLVDEVIHSANSNLAAAGVNLAGLVGG